MPWASTIPDPWLFMWGLLWDERLLLLASWLSVEMDSEWVLIVAIVTEGLSI